MVNRLKFQASAAGLLTVSAILFAWALVTLLRLGSFETAEHSVFSHDPGTDTTFILVKLEYLAAPFGSVVFGLACAVLAVLLLRRTPRWAPLAAVLCSAPIAVVTLLVRPAATREREGAPALGGAAGLAR